MTKVFIMFAIVAFPLTLNATSLTNVSGNSDKHHSKALQQQGGATTNLSIHEDCSCPSDCPCRNEQQAPSDCDCEWNDSHQHE